MTDDRARRLAKLKQAFESGNLDEDTYQAAVAALGGAQTEVIGSGAVAQGAGAVAAGAFEDDKAKQGLALPSDQQPLYLIPVGHPR